MSELTVRLRQALPEAMKRRDRTAVTALRTTLAAIDNAGAIEVAETRLTGAGPIAGARVGLGATEAIRRDLDDEAVAAIVAAEIHDRRRMADALAAAGQANHAATLRAEADALAVVVSA